MQVNAVTMISITRSVFTKRMKEAEQGVSGGFAREKGFSEYFVEGLCAFLEEEEEGKGGEEREEERGGEEIKREWRRG